MDKKLSIITINLNNALGLRKTIESVISQTFSDFEYIIIDGGSTDGSIDVIKEYSDKITYWVSEPDKGIYNAMNKGILKANGEYCLFLNSGDWLVDDLVTADFYSENFKDDIILGNVLRVENGVITANIPRSKEELGFEHFYWGGSLPHQSSFIKRKVFNIYGLYNESLKIASDFEFFIKTLVLHNASYNYFNRNISYYDLTGISSQKESEISHKKELDYIFQTHLPIVYKSYKKILDEKSLLLEHEKYYTEYINLKNGKLGFFVRLLLYIKKIKRSII